MTDSLIGTSIGKYQIRTLLGQGGMAEVYEAYNPGLRRTVALKILHQHLADEEEVRKRFQREAQIVASLRHPNIVQVYDFDIHEGSFYMVMEYIGGGTLRDRLVALAEQGKAMHIEEIEEIIGPVCAGLQYAHEAGMVHRDIKPANIMFTDKGQPVLTDFGIAFLEGAARLTMSGASTGTPAYMSPEQAMGHRGDERSDIYSLGVTLYQMCTNHLPFEIKTPYRMLMAHAKESLPPPRSVNPNLSPQVAAVIEKALRKSPDRRYQEPRELAEALHEAVWGESSKASQTEMFLPGNKTVPAPPTKPASMPERITSMPPPERYTPPPQYTPYSQQPEIIPEKKGSSLTLLALGGTTIVALILILLLLVGAGYYFLTGPGSVSNNKLPVELNINSPTDGSQVSEGGLTMVSGYARHNRGIVRVELWVDGALREVKASDSLTDQAFLFNFQWRATPPGDHQLTLRAYDTTGQMAEKTVKVRVPEGTETAAATPTVKEETPTPPPTRSATDTPTPSPTPTEPPTPTQPPSPTSPPPPKAPAVAPQGVFDDFETPQEWRRGAEANGTFERSTERAYQGYYSGKLTYNFTGGGNDYVVFLHEQALGGTPNLISAWVHGDGSGHFLNLWIKDSGGQTWQMPLGRIQHSGWLKMTAYLAPGQPWPAGHIDGPDNGTIDYPITFRALVLDDIPDSYTGSGAIFLDDLSSESGKPPTPAVTVTPKFPAGTVINLRADRTEMVAGDCTTVRWDVEGVQAVFFEGNGVVGHSSQEVCPQGTTTYHLLVELTDGRRVERTLTLTVR